MISAIRIKQEFKFNIHQFIYQEIRTRSSMEFIQNTLNSTIKV